MASGCPVITSNISSTKEIAGDAALLIDPNNQEELKKVIKKVLSDFKLRNSLIERGKLRVKKFTTKKTAKETLQNYNI